MRRGIGFVVMVSVFYFVHRTGYADTYKQVYHLRAWGGEDKVVFYDGVPGHEGTATDFDINGEVGHPLSVHGPTGYCSHGGTWFADTEIFSGTLPPGLTFRKSDLSISGIPTERGHWIVMMKLSNSYCNDEYYDNFTQQLRFHVTGTGKVIE